MISEFPQLPFPLPQPLQRGFTRTETRALGHWLRDKNAPTCEPPRLGSGPARPPGAPQERGQMEERYTGGDGRHGERSEQLAVRGRYVDFLACAFAAWGRPWTELPGDASDWRLVLPLTEDAVGDD